MHIFYVLKPLQRIEQKRALLLSLVAIASVSAFEVVAGIVSNSMAVLSDGIHALFDALLTAILLIMLMLSMKPRDMEHTYGHGRLETIAGLIGGIILFTVAILIVRESLVRVIDAEAIVPSILGFYAVVVAVCVAIFRAVILAYSMHGMSARVGFYDAIADLGSSILALLGLVLASNGLYAADGIASIALAGMIIFLTSRLVYSSAMELTDAIDPSLVNSARKAILSIDGVKDCKDVRMRKVGRDILADVTVVLANDITFNKAHAISNEVENAVMRATSASRVMVHFEPESEHMPIEHLIEEIVSNVDGVKDVHNVVVSRARQGVEQEQKQEQAKDYDTQDMMIVSMHIQVDRNLRLDEAHRVADMVEHEVKRKVKGVKDITVHIEPFMPEILTLEELKDRGLEDRIKSIASEQGIRHLSNVYAYTCNDILKIDMHCSLDGEVSIEEAHDIISRVERRIRDEFDAIVTIHVEPYRLKHEQINTG
ncbi:MAG: cation-efflux pump [Candidatus Nitrosocaldus sp.]